LFEAFGDCNKLLQSCDASALYLLSAESCPPQARAAALREAEQDKPISHKRALQLKSDHAPTEGVPEVNENGRKRPVTENTPLSARAKIARDEIGENPTPLHRLQAIMRARFHSESTYRAAAQVEASGKKELIAAMDAEILCARDAALLIGREDKHIEKQIEKAKVSSVVQRNKRSASSAGKTKPELLLDLLSRTWIEWRGFSDSFPSVSRIVPQKPDMLKECKRLLPQVRQSVNQLLSAVEKEIANGMEIER